MILLDITNQNIYEKLIGSNDSSYTSDIIKKVKFNIELTNNYKHNQTESEFFENNIKKDETVILKLEICKFLGSGSYGKVYKVRINNTKKYYALKISENEKPQNLKMRYDYLVENEQVKKYIINIYIAGNIKCNKYKYFSIMEYGGHNLKSQIPFQTSDELGYILRQLYNIVYLCEKYRLYFTDFKLNNVVSDRNYKLKLIDLYIDCEKYNPCKGCRIVKTFSTLEIDKMKHIIDDENYAHTYHYIPLGVGLIDLTCKKTASYIFTNLGHKFSINLGIKQMIPLIQVACYNNFNESNSNIKEYEGIYKCKKNLENKYPFIKKKIFYETLMSMIEVREIYHSVITSAKLHTILNYLFSANFTDRTLEPFKKHLSENT